MTRGGGGGVARAASTPAGYLLAAQNADGGFGPAPRQASNQLYSGWVALGLAGAGESPAYVARGGHSLLGYIGGGAGSASDPGSVERTILVARAAGVSPESFGGRNLVSALERDLRPNGSVSNQVNLTAFAVLSLRAAGVAPPAATLPWLVRQQDADGGFNFATRGGLSDPDDTGAALQALAGDGGTGSAHARARAVRYLRGQQDSDGGFPAMPGAGSNAQSTAFAVQGLLAAGVDPGTMRRRGASPLDYLRGLIASDGHVRYARNADQTPTWVTAEALLALAEKTLPLAPVARRAMAPARRPTPHASNRHHATATPGQRRARAARHAPARPAPARRTAVLGAAAPRTADLAVDRLTIAAAILTALSLAPLGQG